MISKFRSKKFSYLINIDTCERSFECSSGPNANISQHSENFTDFSRSSNSTTYQVSTDGMDSSMMRGSIGELNLSKEPESLIGENEYEIEKKPSKEKEETVWIDYHPPPKEPEKGKIYKM